MKTENTEALRDNGTQCCNTDTVLLIFPFLHILEIHHTQ